MPRRDSMIHRSLIAAALAATMLMLGAVKADAGCSKSVTLYSASWCPYCAQVRAILARNNIKYSLLDATTARVQAQMVRRFGDTAVPRAFSISPGRRKNSYFELSSAGRHNRGIVYDSISRQAFSPPISS